MKKASSRRAGAVRGSPACGRGPRRRRSIVLGLLGGISAGKTTVAALFAGEGADVVSADAIVHRHLARRSLRERMAVRLGVALPAALPAFKAALARIIFASARARRKAERLLHPLVDAEIRRRLRRAGGARLIVLDVPLLLETRMSRYCDALAFVSAPAAARAARAAKARGWTARELRARERCQAPLRRKRAASRWRIDNGRGLAATRRQVARIWHELRELDE